MNSYNNHKSQGTCIIVRLRAVAQERVRLYSKKLYTLLTEIIEDMNKIIRSNEQQEKG